MKTCILYSENLQVMIWISVDMGQAWKAFKLNYVGCFNIQDLTSDSLIAMTWTTLCHWTNLGFISSTPTSVNLQVLIWTTLQYGTDIRMFHQSNLDLLKSACPNLNHSLLRNRHKDVSSVDPWLVNICMLQFELLCEWNRHKDVLSVKLWLVNICMLQFELLPVTEQT